MRLPKPCDKISRGKWAVMEKLNSSNIVMIISFYKLPKPCDKISRGKWVIMEKIEF